jgi:TetR/AcrR family transcriptional repressor of nem operon
MSRPRRSEHVREALIQAGIEQISTHGYHGTGIKQILDEVNVPKGSFYNFFASKEAFVSEVIAQYSQDLLQQLDDFIKGPGQSLSAKEQLQSIYEFSLNKVAKSDFKQGCLIGAMSSEIASESTECREQLKTATRKWVAFFIERISQGQAAGEFRQDVSAKELASVYWATWEGSLIKMKMSNRLEPAKDAMHLMLNVLMAPAK